MDAALTLAEAAQVLDPPITERQLRQIVTALRWQPAEVRYSGHSGRPPAAYAAAEIMRLHQALLPWLVTPGELPAYIGRAALCPETGGRRSRVAGMVPGERPGQATAYSPVKHPSHAQTPRSARENHGRHTATRHRHRRRGRRAPAGR